MKARQKKSYEIKLRHFSGRALPYAWYPNLNYWQNCLNILIHLVNFIPVEHESKLI